MVVVHCFISILHRPVGLVVFVGCFLFLQYIFSLLYVAIKMTQVFRILQTYENSTCKTYGLRGCVVLLQGHARRVTLRPAAEDMTWR